ncbi:MAG: heparan-alpha-glucosaminide N-acetyltransferase [Patescibacteria group bacterium]
MTVRLMEIDALRGLAILCMVLFHAAYDAMMLGMLDFEPYGWPLIIFVRAVQFLFLGLVGVSVALSGRGFAGQARRGAWIFCAGMLVTLATWIFFPTEFVRFGVLHLIGVSVPIVALFKERRVLAVCMALASFFVGQVLSGMTVERGWLFWLGLREAGFASLDYFPIFPWIAAPLVGLVVGEWVYRGRQPTRLAVLAKLPGLTAMGRHSLAIYLLHQPVLYFTLWGLKSFYN